MLQSRLCKSVVWMTIGAAGITVVAARAQEQVAAPSGPAPILVTVREMVKPGEEDVHAKLEARYAAALNAAKASQYYLGMGAITGSPQTVFLSGYASLQEMSDVHDYDEVNFGDQLDSLASDHGKSLSGMDTAIWRLRPELCNPDVVNLGKMRFMELIHIHVKLGHSVDFLDVTRRIREAWMRADPNFHYAIYQQIYGGSTDDSYLVMVAMKSLADLDKHNSLLAEFQKTLGEEAQKHIREVESADYNSTESNLFVFTPSMSRLPESWTKGDQDFWNPKLPAAPVKKPATAK